MAVAVKYPNAMKVVGRYFKYNHIRICGTPVHVAIESNVDVAEKIEFICSYFPHSLKIKNSDGIFPVHVAAAHADFDVFSKIFNITR